MIELVNKALLNGINSLDQMEQEELWINTHNKLNKLSKSIQVSLYALDETEIQTNGSEVAIINARRTLEEACKQ